MTYDLRSQGYYRFQRSNVHVDECIDEATKDVPLQKLATAIKTSILRGSGSTNDTANDDDDGDQDDDDDDGDDYDDHDNDDDDVHQYGDDDGDNDNHHHQYDISILPQSNLVYV